VDQGVDEQYSTPCLDDDLLQKVSQERIWYLKVYKHIEPNEHDVSQQAWWLSEDLDCDFFFEAPMRCSC